MHKMHIFLLLLVILTGGTEKKPIMLSTLKSRRNYLRQKRICPYEPTRRRFLF